MYNLDEIRQMAKFLKTQRTTLCFNNGIWSLLITKDGQIWSSRGSEWGDITGSEPFFGWELAE